MSVDFEAISGKTASETKMKPPLPVGSYRASISGVAHLQSSTKKTDCIAFGVKVFESLDADEAELEAFGDWQGYEFKPKAMPSDLTFFITADDSMNYLAVKDENTGEWRGFLPEIAQVAMTEESIAKKIWAEDEDGNPDDCLCLDAVGEDIIITVGQSQSDKGRVFAEITEVHANSQRQRDDFVTK